MIKIVKTNIIRSSLLRRLCKVLTKKELDEMGYLELKMTPKGKTGIRPILPKTSLVRIKNKKGHEAYISFYSIYFRMNLVCNPYYNFNERLAGHLYWIFATILHDVRHPREYSSDWSELRRIENEFMRRAKRMRLLDVKRYNEYGLFWAKKNEFIDKQFAVMKQDKGKMWKFTHLFHMIRKAKLGKNVRYSTQELYSEVFGSNKIYRETDKKTADIGGVKLDYYGHKTTICQEYRLFRKEIEPKLPKKTYVSKSGKHFNYFEERALKKLYLMFIDDFDLFCRYKHFEADHLGYSVPREKKKPFPSEEKIMEYLKLRHDHLKEEAYLRGY